MKKRWIFGILCMLWMFVIFQFSASQGTESQGLSDRIAIMLSNLFPFIAYNDTLTFVIRKLAHFSEYAVLGLLYYQFLTTYPFQERTNLIVSCLLTLLYAATDEFHQLFIDGRSGQLRDVLIDTAGGCVGTLMSAWLTRVFRKRKGNS